MRFELRHTFPCSPEALWALIDDARYEDQLALATRATRQVLELRHEGGQRVIRRRITAQRTLPAPMAKLVGAEQITYEQHTARQDGSDTMRWSISPMVMADRVSAQGTTVIRPHAQGCERVISGQVSIAVPVMGAKMEARLVEDIRAGYEEGARILRELIASP